MSSFASQQGVLETGFRRIMPSLPWICISPFGKEQLQIMQNLKSIELVSCNGVTNISDLSGFRNLVELKLKDCENVVEVDLSVGFKNLVSLKIRGSKRVQKFVIVTQMKFLKSLDLSKTAIKELSSSTVRNLSKLEKLCLKGCWELIHVPCNIFDLQHLQLLNLEECGKLVTFPTKSELSTESTSSQDRHYAPLTVSLSGCNGLVEITEFPQQIYRLDVSNCFTLTRISNLSDIVEGKELRMIPQINLRNCPALCPILARDVSKMKKNSPDNSQLTALFHLFFSCRQCEHQVVFHGIDPDPYIVCRPLRSYEDESLPDIRLPGWFTCSLMDIESLAQLYYAHYIIPDVRFPEWFTCRMDIETAVHDKPYFRIDFPGNFKWEDKGLAFCISTCLDYTSAEFTAYLQVVRIYVNGVSIIERHRSEHRSDYWWFESGGFVWLCYMPFNAIIKRLGESGLPPPSVCRITFEFKVVEIGAKLGRAPGLSCGFHVVMPEDEGSFVNGTLRKLHNEGWSLRHHHQLSTTSVSSSVVNFLKNALCIYILSQFLERTLASSPTPSTMTSSVLEADFNLGTGFAAKQIQPVKQTLRKRR